MIKFLTAQEITPSFRRGLKTLAVISSGALFGYWKSRIVKEKYQNIDGSKLTQYESQDQINTLIEKTQKPAIIYYYLAVGRSHHFYRLYMRKFSNLYPDNCHWVMVNLTKNFQQAKKTFSLEYPLDVHLQVRYPKSKVIIRVGEQAIQKVDHRRVPYSFDFRQDSFRAFLQYHGIIKAQDPVFLTLQTTNKALFRK